MTVECQSERAHEIAGSIPLLVHLGPAPCVYMIVPTQGLPILPKPSLNIRRGRALNSPRLSSLSAESLSRSRVRRVRKIKIPPLTSAELHLPRALSPVRSSIPSHSLTTSLRPACEDLLSTSCRCARFLAIDRSGTIKKKER